LELVQAGKSIAFGRAPTNSRKMFWMTMLSASEASSRALSGALRSGR